MREELDKLLVEKYPKIFVNRYKPMNETAMCWGFCCGEGWFNILDKLCDNIQSHIDWQNKQGNAVPQVVATQVKEKFGTLRFYYDGGNDYIDGMVRMAESISGVTCEECGSPGETGGKGWITTLCQKHRDEREDCNNLLKQGFEG